MVAIYPWKSNRTRSNEVVERMMARNFPPGDSTKIRISASFEIENGVPSPPARADDRYFAEIFVRNKVSSRRHSRFTRFSSSWKRGSERMESKCGLILSVVYPQPLLSVSSSPVMVAMAFSVSPTLA